MRRISIAMMLLLVTQGIAQAYYNVPLHCRVRYSPYAFGIHNSGLVPGGIVYSPYAFGIQNSGLVFEGVRYTPYAFGINNSGLVLDYCYYPVPVVVYNSPCTSDRVSCKCDMEGQRYGSAQRSRNMSNYPRSYQYSRDTASPSATNRYAASAESEEPLVVIRRHLREQGFSDVGVNRILRIDNKLVSADFTLGGSLLIKYWDPTQVELLNANARGQRTLERYKNEWEAFAGKYQQDGGQIAVVAASGRTDIVAALNACDSLNPGGAKPAAQPVYAKQ